ncbi:MAG: hypothetical protein R6V04_03750 [bacterium]
MKCNESPEKIISLIYDEINEDKKKCLLKHIESCSSCKKIYRELTDTKKILGTWEDKDPDINLVFSQKPETWLQRIKENIKSFSVSQKFALAVPAAVFFLFLLLSVFNFQARQIDGNWHVSFSIFPRKDNYSENLNAAVQKAISNSREETIQLVSELIEQSQYQQKVEFTQTLNSVTEQLQSQRLNDFRLFYQDLANLQQTTENNFSQTRDVLSDLVDYASLHIEKK